jgi:negative regulator of flagellin synthesis FlgM
MKINEHQSVRNIVNISKNSAAQSSAQKFPPAPPGDRVSLSPQARELMKAQQALANLPDIREDKVAELKARIDEGRYRIDKEGIAEKMIREGLSEQD